MLKLRKAVLLSLFLVSFVYPTFSQQIIGTYSIFIGGTLDTTQKIKLIKNNGAFSFCIIDAYRDTLIDSIIYINDKPQEIPILKWIHNHDCTHSFDPYKFRKKKTGLYISYYDEDSKDFRSIKQYPLKSGDTTDYIYLFSGPHYKNPSFEGKPCYHGDTTLSSNRGPVSHCYIFEETRAPGIDQKAERRKIYIDKQTLIPIRYDIFTSSKYISYILNHR